MYSSHRRTVHDGYSNPPACTPGQSSNALSLFLQGTCIHGGSAASYAISTKFILRGFSYQLFIWAWCSQTRKTRARVTHRFLRLTMPSKRPEGSSVIRLSRRSLFKRRWKWGDRVVAVRAHCEWPVKGCPHGGYESLRVQTWWKKQDRGKKPSKHKTNLMTARCITP